MLPRSHAVTQFSIQALCPHSERFAWRSVHRDHVNGLKRSGNGFRDDEARRRWLFIHANRPPSLINYLPAIIIHLCVHGTSGKSIFMQSIRTVVSFALAQSHQTRELYQYTREVQPLVVLGRNIITTLYCINQCNVPPRSI